FLQVTFMGYMNHVEYAKIQNKTSNIHEFEDIILREGDTMLEEVLVMEDRIPIMIKKDTIEYNAGSFDVHENALVEELLQELPGVEVAEDGTIKANGKEVKNVLVDGQEFFGSDPKMATQNLPAKAVDKVQVYEKESDEAKFSGMANLDDEETTINLKLKEEYKKGYLGKAEIGGGTDNTFTSRLSLNRFDKKNQISVIGRMNNTTNKSGLTMNESINFAGGISSLMDNIGGDNMVAFNSGSSQHEGLNTIGLLGVNYNWKANPKIKISANYKLDFVKSDLDETKFQENNIANLNYSSIDTLYKDSRSLMNLANLKFKFKPDSTLRVNWTNKIQFNIDGMDNAR
ncbi:MAG: hypothetical protein ACPG5P_09330, partial [Saprospiraceae bacterium]